MANDLVLLTEPNRAPRCADCGHATYYHREPGPPTAKSPLDGPVPCAAAVETIVIPATETPRRAETYRYRFCGCRTVHPLPREQRSR